MIKIETGFTGITYPLTTPRIGAYPVTATITASTSATGFDADNANNALTYTAWQPTAVPATWDMSFTSTDISYVGVAAHNIGTVGGQIAVQEWTGAAWANIDVSAPTDDSPIFFLFDTRTTDRLRIRVTAAIPTIGVIWAGNVLEFPVKCQWTSSVPFNEAVNTVYADNVSDGGHVLDRFQTRKAGLCAMSVQNLSETWAAANLPTLQAHMKSLPIFMADRPSDYTKSVVFGMQQEPLRAERTRPVLGAARSVTFNIMANEPV